VCKDLNINLDKTIRVLYNSWFVDFLPFQNQGFKDTYMGKIPNGWEIKNLDEVCDKISDSYKPDSEEVVLIQTSDVSKGKVLNHEKVPNDDYKGHFKYKFEKNDILYTQIRPKNERYAFINFDPINYVASTQLMVLRAKPNIILPYILYLFLTSRDMIMEVNLLAESRSGTFPQINFNEIKHEKVIVAPFEVYENFWNIIKSLVEKKFIVDDEIIKLTQLRDALLPKLMSGEIDVSKINCDMPQTARKNCDNKFTLTFQNNLIEVIS
jgi:type I restriction enzyme S subunit